MKKVLITGITGFAGSFLAEHLLKNPECSISGTYLSDNSLQNVASIREKLDLEKVDLMDANAVSLFISNKRPDFVYHLAALASPGKSFKNPSETIVNNITAQLNLLEAIKNENLLSTRVLVVSSADIYGIVSPENLPIDEETPFNPTSPYAVSKIAQDFLGLQYELSYKLPVIRVRPFNHIGPRQALSFAVSDFAKKIVDIEKGKTPSVLKVGSLNMKRDFTDVRDMVRAYNLIMEKGKIGDVYNIGSGVSHALKDIVEMMQSLAKVSFTLEEDPTLIRPNDNPELVCDPSKIKTATGWQPEIPLETTLKDTLDYWRNIG